MLKYLLEKYNDKKFIKHEMIYLVIILFYIIYFLSRKKSINYFNFIYLKLKARKT